MLFHKILKMGTFALVKVVVLNTTTSRLRFICELYSMNHKNIKTRFIKTIRENSYNQNNDFIFGWKLDGPEQPSCVDMEGHWLLIMLKWKGDEGYCFV